MVILEDPEFQKRPFSNTRIKDNTTFLRIQDNILGCIFALIFYYIFEMILNSKKYKSYMKQNTEYEANL